MPLTKSQLTEIRKEFHQYPEVSENEHKTQERIIRHLESLDIDSFIKCGKTGVLVTFDSKIDGPSILIRGDIDALPIQEINTFEHKSTSSGVSHKCGHDGHTTILLGLADHLKNYPISKGKVYLIFQPAEENGMGAKAVLADPNFPKENIDFVFALHNLPGFPLSQVVYKEDEFTCNVKSIIIKLNGKTAHAAEPEKGYNPALAIAEIHQYAEAITKNEPEAKDFFLITPIYINMGEIAHGISAGYGEVHLTIRSWSTQLMDKMCTQLVNKIQSISEKYHLQFEHSWLQEFFANVNHPEAVKTIQNAIDDNNFNAIKINTPFKWGEDFGLFTQKYKGAMFGIGAGENTPALHNPDYDFPDEITATGIEMFSAIIQNLMKND